MIGDATATDLRQLAKADDGEKAIAKKIAFIHALAKYMLRVDEEDAKDIVVGFQMHGQEWQARVSYQGFTMMQKSIGLNAALDYLMESMTSLVSKHLEEGEKLLKNEA